MGFMYETKLLLILLLKFIFKTNFDGLVSKTDSIYLICQYITLFVCQYNSLIFVLLWLCRNETTQCFIRWIKPIQRLTDGPVQKSNALRKTKYVERRWCSRCAIVGGSITHYNKWAAFYDRTHFTVEKLCEMSRQYVVLVSSLYKNSL